LKIRLIEPKYRANWTEQDEKDIRSFWFPRITLPLIAALTPEGIEVGITDENVTPIDYDERPDLVGLTAMTMHAHQAYSIADRFRSMGIPVVFGGIHASMMPHEAKKHCDAVVIGEAEQVWPRLLDDFDRGKLKPFYGPSTPPPLKGLPRPRMELLDANAYDNISCIQTTRGCPFNCDYCSVSHFFGHRLRYRPIPEVIEEVKSLNEKRIVFVDDNIVGNPSYARGLFQKLIPLNIRWGGQASITIARDPSLLRLASESGCYSLFIGIESLLADNLISMNKRINRVNEYEDAIKRIHDHGITVIGSFIFGMDHDDASIFERTVRFCEKNRIELPVFFILTPVPGTRLFKRLKEEGRILSEDWSKYDGATVLFQPRLLSVESLQNGFNWACKEVYSWNSILRRIVLPPHRRFIQHLSLNIIFRRIAKRWPNGRLSQLSKLTSKFSSSIPVRDISEIIPTIAESTSNWEKDLEEGAKKILNVKLVINERISTIFLFLEGAMDMNSAKVLLRKLEKILHETHERIVIDFGMIDFLSPKATTTLLQESLSRLKDRIRFANLNQKIKGMIENLPYFLEGTTISGEEMDRFLKT
jgi:radical SAM superfamily enzyme YgiQ (UPF0313 family)/anti-anti-sigma regulatory factor